MIPFWLWSWLLLAIGIVGIWATGSKKSYGWLICISVQVLWIAYGLVTEQHGFIVSALVYGFVYLRNYLRWRRERLAAAAPPPAAAISADTITYCHHCAGHVRPRAARA
jgi:uncharacterized membrane protein YcfT